jgi:hypothetical protein
LFRVGDERVRYVRDGAGERVHVVRVLWMVRHQEFFLTGILAQKTEKEVPLESGERSHIIEAYRKLVKYRQ